MSVINLGREEKNYMEGPVTAGSSKKKTIIRHPSFNVNDIQLPLDQKDVGKTVTAVVHLRVNKAGAEIEEYTDNKKRYRSEFSVMGIDFAKKKVDIKNISEADLDAAEESEYERGKKTGG